MPRMIRILRGATVACFAAAGLAPASALAAQSCQAPAGTAAVDQGCEAIPGPDRERAFSDRRGAGGPVPRAAVRALMASGSDGRALLDHLVDVDPNQSGLQMNAFRRPNRAASGNASDSAGDRSNDPLSALGSAVAVAADRWPGLVSGVGGVTLLATIVAWAYNRGKRRRSSGLEQS